jgi:UDP-glucose:(heptosyl)LPS alpha-1,3-glucosyltransferase
MKIRPRVAVVSPFLDKRHGTERCVAEQVERLSNDYEVHLYAARVCDVDLSKIIWHRTGHALKPHVLAYLWFFISNHAVRAYDKWFRKLDFDIVFSPGINCFDADIIAVHIVFAEYVRLAQRDLRFLAHRLIDWPRLLHRRLSYRLFIALERAVYAKQEVPLIVISKKMEQDLERSFQRNKNLRLLYHGIDPTHMNPEVRAVLREGSRFDLSIPPQVFAILLIGNDWRKKGLYLLLEAVSSLENSDIWILVRGDDASSSCQDTIIRLGLGGQVKFLKSIPEIDPYYAASDLYIGPSLEDSFAIPPLEAMACGLPVIVSSRAGVSELITHAENGFILDDPTDVKELASLIHTNYKNPDLRSRIGQCAAQTAGAYTWQRNGERFKKIIDEFLEGKSQYVLPDKLATRSTI